MFKTEVGRVTGQVVALSVYGLTTLLGVPLLTNLFPPEFPTPVIGFVAVVLSATVLSVIWSVASRTAHLKVKWTTLDDSKELIDIDPRIDSSTTYGRESYWVHVEFERAWGIGWVVLRWAVSKGLWIKVTAQHSSLVLQLDDLERISLEEQDAKSGPGCTILIRVRPPVPGPERAWNSTFVRVDGKRKRPDEVAELMCNAEAPGRVFGWICHKYIKVDTKALTITERWR